MSFRFPLVMACLLTLGAGLAPAQNKIDQMTDALDAAMAQFVRDKAAEKQKVLKAFDDLITKVTNNYKMKSAERLTLRDSLRAERSLFDQKEDFAEDSELVKAGWLYGNALVKKYQPVSKKFDAVMDYFIKDGDTAQAQRIQADKEKFDDKHMPGRQYFVSGANYEGTQRHGTSSTLFRFRVKELKGGRFTAFAERDLQSPGHPMFKINGSLDGIHVHCTGLKNVVGNVKLDSCEGVVLGETLLLKFSTSWLKTVGKGKGTRQTIETAQSIAVLRKR